MTQTAQTVSSPLFTMKETMSYMRISRSTLYRLMWSGKLQGHKVGSTWRFYKSDLRRYLGESNSLSNHKAPDTITDEVHQQI